MNTKIPRSLENDYTQEMAAIRRQFLFEQTGQVARNVGSYSFDPAILPGNIENFIGVAQVPIGLAGPLLVNGEYAKGRFYIPLATTEGTLVASYNRGMKLLEAAGGITTTISDDAMQRAPVFIFPSARQAREFGKWVTANFEHIKKEADKTTHSGHLRDIEQYTASRLLFLRFNYTTGDAAGQNMVSKATKSACDWINSVYPGIEHYFLESNFATDKKSSYVNMLHTRGKRVTAEAIIPGYLLEAITHTDPDQLLQARQVINLGSFLAGAHSNGAHSVNGITALFIATGQDVATIAEASAELIYAEPRPGNNYYYSVTIPSLIVATYGGGTGLPTQRECLEIMGCYGKDGVRKFAEIVAATVLCGELSLGTAVVSEEWVSSHERFGRNRR
ncbi:MAG: hydroxymethylglutaryl-CoA reductase [Chloroflexi bacterium]|nr:hydroxymethylglutaryl-CoA reductase [Chloroflexota bacterium]OJW01855.1 MAG: hydroxymethylglutaryl-CoA reductase [Chloroflexi bacterium 54-19]